MTLHFKNSHDEAVCMIFHDNQQIKLSQRKTLVDLIFTHSQLSIF